MTNEIVVSVDVETTGPYTGLHSMISLGAVAFDQCGRELTTFKVNMGMVLGTTYDPNTLKWWKANPGAWEAARRNPVYPQTGMTRFSRWIDELKGKPKLASWPLMFDFMWVLHYWGMFMEKEPAFGLHDGIDIKSYAMRAMSCRALGEVSRSKFLEIAGLPTEIPHDPLEDARIQGRLFFAIRNMNRL